MTEERSAIDQRPSPGLEIRLARPEEIEDASALIRAAYAEYADAMGDERWQRYMANASQVMSSTGTELFVAEQAERLIGAVTFYPPGESSVEQGWPAEWAGVRLLGVTPQARGTGAGRALIEALIHRARELGATALALHTTERMVVARGMYERMGFQRDERYDWGGASGRGAFAYRFDLRPSSLVGEG